MEEEQPRQQQRFTPFNHESRQFVPLSRFVVFFLFKIAYCQPTIPLANCTATCQCQRSGFLTRPRRAGRMPFSSRSGSTWWMLVIPSSGEHWHWLLSLFLSLWFFFSSSIILYTSAHVFSKLPPGPSARKRGFVSLIVWPAWRSSKNAQTLSLSIRTSACCSPSQLQDFFSLYPPSSSVLSQCQPWKLKTGCGEW